MESPLIKAENLWKRYGLIPTPSIKDILNNIRNKRPPFTTNEDMGLWSLKNINFEIKKGEVLGIVGKNGAGKSTLLKVLAGVSPATRGTVYANGRVFPMIELSAGMHADLTGRENVRLLGAVMGIPRREMEDKLPAIEEFCELGEWLDRPVFQYSSGMLARLGFGVAMNINAEILLIDEVLSVGDFAFQKKSINKMSSLINSGVTVIMVSHSPYVVERICDRALLLEGGELKFNGKPSEVLAEYYKQGPNKSKNNASLRITNTAMENRPGTGDVRVINIELRNKYGEVVSELKTNEPCYFVINYIANEEVVDPYFNLTVTDVSNTVLTYINNVGLSKDNKIRKGKGSISYFIENWNLMPGGYTISVGVSLTLYRLDIWTDALNFEVVADEETIHKSAGLGLVRFEPDVIYGGGEEISFFLKFGCTLENIKLSNTVFPTFSIKNYERDTEVPKLIVVSYMPNKEASLLLKSFIDSIYAYTDSPFELWVADNNSPVEYIKWLIGETRANFIFNRMPIDGGSLANAVGIELALRFINPNSKYVMTFHQDTAPCKKGWLLFLLTKFSDQIRAVGVRMDHSRDKSGVLHVLGMLFDYQLYKKVGADFYPELPSIDTGDKVTASFRKAGYNVYASPNSLWNPEIIKTLPPESPFNNISCDRSVDDRGEVYFLHLGRGTIKSSSNNMNASSPVVAWHEFISSLLRLEKASLQNNER